MRKYNCNKIYSICIIIIIIVIIIILGRLDKIIHTKLVDPDDVHLQLVPVCAKWYQFGSAFKVPFNFLEELEESNDPNKKRLRKVINEWYKKDSEDNIRNWDTVLKIVKGPLIDNLKHANEILEWLGEEEQLTRYEKQPDKYQYDAPPDPK